MARPAPRILRPAAAVVVSVVVSVGLLAACGGDDSSSSPPPELSAAGERGEQVAKENGCTACHTADGGKSTGPTWKDLAGSEVELDGGETVVADDEYLRTAILDPKSQVVAGYPNIMPVYENQLSDEELDDLIAYLRDLSTVTNPADADAGGDGN